jgi:Zn-finger nucleic acid-binding protein
MSAFRDAPRQLGCPRCGLDLEHLSSGVEICARCEGVWLPKLAIEKTFGTAYWPAGPSVWWRRELECPACAVENRGSIMTPILAANIVVDRCPEHGQWLDAGELGRLLDAPRAIELEAFYERLRPDAELPARLVAFRKERQEAREKRAAELESYRKELEAHQEKIRAEQDAARAAERARVAELAEQERRAILTKQREELDALYRKTEGDIRAKERALTASREEIDEREKDLQRLREKVRADEKNLGDTRARLVEIEAKLAEIEQQLR